MEAITLKTIVKVAAAMCSAVPLAAAWATVMSIYHKKVDNEKATWAYTAAASSLTMVGAIQAVVLVVIRIFFC